MTDLSRRVTGSWVVRIGTSYLTGVGGTGLSWSSNPADAKVFPTKAAAQQVIKALGGAGDVRVIYERSFGHEAQQEAERHKREQTG